MALLVEELSVCQEKFLKTASLLIELEEAIGADSESEKRDELSRALRCHQSLLRLYGGLATFLNACIEVEREKKGTVDPAASVRRATDRA